MDKWTDSDIDRVFGRLQQDVDILHVKSREELFEKVKASDKNRYWNKEMNDFFYNIAFPERLNKNQSARLQAELDKRYAEQSPYQVKISRPKRQKWSESEVDTAFRLRKEGLTYKQIASHTNRSPSSISSKFSRLKKRK
jgi:DNA-binding NarL/FixJ family response regulator